MFKKGSFLALICLVTLFSVINAYAQSQQITNGLNYLTSTQNADGSWEDDSSSGKQYANHNLTLTLWIMFRYKCVNKWIESKFPVVLPLDPRANIIKKIPCIEIPCGLAGGVFNLPWEGPHEGFSI